MDDEKYSSQPLRLDETAESANPDLPAFLSRPKGAPVYHGFSLVEETRTDGWCFGAITEFEDPEGCKWGDGFVVAPDGSRAGIVWEVGEQEIQVVLPLDEGRWGVYAVWFPRSVKTVDDLVFNFRHVLPELQKKYAKINDSEGAGNKSFDSTAP
jgi:hypothetical protein